MYPPEQEPHDVEELPVQLSGVYEAGIQMVRSRLQLPSLDIGVLQKMRRQEPRGPN